ncbi:MAG: hypothetical protein K2X39_05875, partial [Silvanigrellaceae bacterium]|nr:hypothetical protein [Silvanigrellaceae bacterium]
LSEHSKSTPPVEKLTPVRPFQQNTLILRPRDENQRVDSLGKPILISTEMIMGIWFSSVEAQVLNSTFFF